MKNKFAFITILVLWNLLNCCNFMTKTKEVKIGDFTYLFSDSLSSVVIYHSECTECLDAEVESGQIFLPYSLEKELKSIFKSKGSIFLPSGRDLYLFDANLNEIGDVLFGNKENFMTKWHNKYYIKGKIIGIKNSGLIFRVDSFEKIGTLDD